RLGAIETDRVDRALDRAQREREHRRRRVGQGEQPRRRRARRLVLRAQREETAGEDAKRIAPALARDGGKGGDVPRGCGALEARDDAAHGAFVRETAGARDGQDAAGRDGDAGTAGAWRPCQNASSVEVASSSVRGGRPANGSTRTGQPSTVQM